MNNKQKTYPYKKTNTSLPEILIASLPIVFLWLFPDFSRFDIDTSFDISEICAFLIPTVTVIFCIVGCILRKKKLVFSSFIAAFYPFLCLMIDSFFIEYFTDDGNILGWIFAIPLFFSEIPFLILTQLETLCFGCDLFYVYNVLDNFFIFRFWVLSFIVTCVLVTVTLLKKNKSDKQIEI